LFYALSKNGSFVELRKRDYSRYNVEGDSAVHSADLRYNIGVTNIKDYLTEEHCAVPTPSSSPSAINSHHNKEITREKE
jgi:hypothetical protein